MKHTSKVQAGGEVTFPEWRGERLYMVPFTRAAGLQGAAARFQGTVDQMFAGVAVAPEQECYLMVDEAEVSPGAYHRRPGLHVDGYWDAGLRCHGGHTPSPPRHLPRPEPKKHSAPHDGVSEGLLLASNYEAARALAGEYERDFESDWRGGDCSGLHVAELRGVPLSSGRVWRLDVFSLHESLPVAETVRRTVVRVNVPGMRI